MTWSAIYLMGCGFTLLCVIESVCEQPAVSARHAKSLACLLCLGVIAWPLFWLALILRRTPQ